MWKSDGEANIFRRTTLALNSSLASKGSSVNSRPRRRGFVYAGALPFFAVIPLIVWAILSHTAILSKFDKQESVERKRDMRICLSLIQDKSNWLLTQTQDYATWDEMYSAVRNPDPDWIESNLTGWVPEHFGIDAVMLTDTRRDIVASHGVDGSLEWAVLRSRQIGEAVSGDSSTGLLRAGGKVYIVSTCPVLPNSGRGTVRGTLTFAKLIGPDMLDQMRRIARCDLALCVGGKAIVTDSKVPPDHLPANTEDGFWNAMESDITVVETSQDHKRVFAWHRLNDWDHKHVAALLTITSRTTILANRQAVSFRSILLVIACLLTVLLASSQIRIAMLAQHALCDELTGLHNHRYMQERLAQEINRSKRYGRPLAVALLDIDHFKQVNDEYGHLVGDQTLKQLARYLKDNVRDTDVVARYGGEEFLVIMPETTLDEAVSAADRLRHKVDHSTYEARVSGTIGRRASRVALRFTISIGVAGFPRHATGQDELLMAADLALFAAKRASRNAVRSYDVICAAHSGKCEDPSSIHQAMREGTLSIVRALAAAVDARDDRMRGHSEKVAIYALAMGRSLELSDLETNTLRTAALLHDVGCIGVPDEILKKPGELTDEERDIVALHSVRGAEILAKAPQLTQVAKIVRHHHERFDGSGYPDGLKCEEIPLESRIIAAAEAFDALTSDRPYRSGSSHADALQVMIGASGSHFDPFVVEALSQVVTSGRLSELIDQFNDELDAAA